MKRELQNEIEMLANNSVCWLCSGLCSESFSLTDSFAPQHPSGPVTSISMLQVGKLRHIMVSHSARKVVGPGFECKHLVSESWTLNGSQNTPLSGAFLIKMSTKCDSCSVTWEKLLSSATLKLHIYYILVKFDMVKQEGLETAKVFKWF